MTAPHRPQVNWTPNLVELIRTMDAQGVAASRIAEAVSHIIGFKCSRNAVIGKLARLLGSTRDRHPPRKSGPAKRKMVSLTPPHHPGPPKIACQPLPHTELIRANPVKFMDRAPDQCAWPLDDEASADMRVCGQPVAQGAYCADCARLAYNPEMPKRKSYAA